MLGRVALAALLALCISPVQGASGQPDPQSSPLDDFAQNAGLIVIPAGTAVNVALTSPVWSKTAKPGEIVYAQSIFPVVVHGQIAIPPGTYISGTIESLARRGVFSPHAALQISFNKIVFANGYAVELPNLPVDATAAPDVIPAVSVAYVEVARESTVLLDNGSQLQVTLQLPLALDTGRVAAALPKSKSPELNVSSAVVCQPTPGTPGTPGTVIPGTPATPGTPDTVIPGGPGQPDIVVPGTPGTPGTPDTVIPGTPGTPGTMCPALPVVVPHGKEQPYKESFRLGASAVIGGKQLAPGDYEVRWMGLGPSVQVQIVAKGGIAVQAPARVVLLRSISPASTTALRTSPDGAQSVDSIRFAGQAFALYFH